MSEITVTKTLTFDADNMKLHYTAYLGNRMGGGDTRNEAKEELLKNVVMYMDYLEKEVAFMNKALELACERVKYFEEMQDREMGFSEFFGYDSDYDLKAIIEQYKEQAKEMMKDE